VLSADDLRDESYHVTALSEFFYRNLHGIGDLETLSDAELAENLDAHAAMIMQVDVDGNGVIDYEDVLHWKPMQMEQIVEAYRDPILHENEKLHTGNGENGGGDEQTCTIEAQHLPEGAWVWDGEGVTSQYDGECRLVSQTWGSRKNRFEYDAAGALTHEYIDRFGDGSSVDIYTFENGRLVHQHIDHNDYSSEIDYIYDEAGYLVRREERYLGITEIEYYDHDGNVIKHEYYDHGTLIPE